MIVRSTTQSKQLTRTSQRIQRSTHAYVRTQEVGLSAYRWSTRVTPTKAAAMRREREGEEDDTTNAQAREVKRACVRACVCSCWLAVGGEEREEGSVWLLFPPPGPPRTPR